jgi:alkanesulfonate monooxygenase SsuD/methylene tetrahydromethanopterin reductase-like flavin-dependent oxidoreductase (luciferase family)
MGRDSDRPDDKTRGETMEKAQTDYQYNIDNGLAIVGSPDTVIAKLQEGHKRIGYDLFCTSFIGRLSPEETAATMELWGKEVIPAFK